jgi:hypothetical protein
MQLRPDLFIVCTLAFGVAVGVFVGFLLQAFFTQRSTEYLSFEDWREFADPRGRRDCSSVPITRLAIFNLKRTLAFSFRRNGRQ